jgi:hypothetical protein
MQKKTVLLILLIAILLAAGFVVYRSRPVPTKFRLHLTGTPGLKVSGHYVADGQTSRFSGTLPAEITATARAFDYSIWMDAAKGELSGELRAETGVVGSSATQDEFRGVRGGYQHGWGAKSAWFTTLNKDERPER